MPGGKKQTVVFIVLELAQGGELFDFVAQTGRFGTSVTDVKSSRI